MAEFKRGSLVLVKNDDGKEIEARVVSYRPSTALYNVMLTNGDTELVKPSALTLNEKADQTRRKSRMAKSSSPSRSRSRGRQRSRTRSPGRARKSSGPTSRRSAPATRVEKSEPEKEMTKAEPVEKPNPETAPKTSVKESNGESKTEAEATSRRRSTRLAAIENDKDQKVKPAEKPTEVESKKPSSKYQATWLSILGAVICTISIPVSILVMNMMCDKKNCHLRMLSVPKRLATFYDKNAWLAYLVFAALQAVLLILPIGRRIEGPSTAGGRKTYRLNGWISLLVTLGSLYGLRHYGLPVEIIRTKFFALMTAAWVFGSLLSVVVYIKNRVRPTKDEYFRGQTGNVLVDWHAGRETIPRLGSYFDAKLFGVRLSVNGLAVMLAGLTYLAYTKTNGQLPNQVYACLAMMTIFVLDFYWRENDYLTTFDYLKTGAGYTFFTCAALYPFIFSLPMRFLHDQLEHKLLVELHAPVVAGIGVLFLVGYILYMVANRIKNSFRRDPNSKRFVDLESIPTSRGKALIVSGPWGWVRHPNYVGDMIMATCVAAATGFGHFMPFVCPLGLAVMFLLRAYDDESRLQQKYGSAWTRYCQRVPFRFVPKVY